MNDTASDVAAVSAEAVTVARVRGEPLSELPEDLYIPPEALEVFLDAFEGPLDLLLYLIRRQNLDILDIPVLLITRQYMEYIELMQVLKLELAAEYLVMAAMLAEIKSRMLLPRPVAEDEEEADPRMELVRRLQEYERFKSAAERLDALPRVGRDIHLASARPPATTPVVELPVPELQELLTAFRDAMQRVELFTRHEVQREPLSVRERMSHILSRLSSAGATRFHELVDPAEGRIGVVVCFIALLELIKGAMVEVSQAGPFEPLLIGVAGAGRGVEYRE